MIELIFTRYLYVGSAFKPPKDFEVTEIRPLSNMSRMVLVPNYYGSFNQSGDAAAVSVTLKKQAKPGEKIEIPNGCSMEIQK